MMNSLKCPACKQDRELADQWERLVTALRDDEHIEFGRDSKHGVETMTVCNRTIQATVYTDYALDRYSRLHDEYGRRAQLAESNNGVDWKALMHAVRVAHEAEELLTTGRISFPRPEAALLLEIRQGLLPYQAVAEMIEDGLVRLEECGYSSTLRNEPDRAFAEELILDRYRAAVAGPKKGGRG